MKHLPVHTRSARIAGAVIIALCGITALPWSVKSDAQGNSAAIAVLRSGQGNGSDDGTTVDAKDSADTLSKYGIMTRANSYRWSHIEWRVNRRRTISDTDLAFVTNLLNTPPPKDTIDSREILQGRLMMDLEGLRSVTPREAEMLYTDFKPDLSADWALKCFAIRVFSKANVTEAMPDLRRLMLDPNVEVRTQAKKGLDRFRENSAID